jgi:hypothetical protein
VTHHDLFVSGKPDYPNGTWRNDASCIGYDQTIFFPHRGESITRAKEICADCPVQVQCVEDALMRREPAGVRGGLSQHRRRDLMKQLTSRGIEIPKVESYKAT